MSADIVAGTSDQGLFGSMGAITTYVLSFIKKVVTYILSYVKWFMQKLTTNPDQAITTSVILGAILA